MKYFLFLLLLPTFGCAQMLIDNMTDNAIKMMKASEEIRKERRKESYSIEGTIKTIEMREREIPDSNPDNLKKDRNGNKVTISQPNVKVKYCVILFTDGREKELNSIPSKPLESGKYYVIKYNGLDEVTEITEKEAK